MACPYFYPTEKLEWSAWPHPRRLPLGSGFAGICTADAEEQEPGEKALEEWCNLGYGRGRCPRFPSGEGPDAARFAVADDGAVMIRLHVVVERDHRPYHCCEAEFDPERAVFLEPPGNRVLARQAQMYVESYLRHRAWLRLR